MKNKKQVFPLFLFGVILCTNFVFLSCNSDDTNFTSSENEANSGAMPFLDITSDPSKLSVEDIKILAQAEERLDPFIKVEQESYIITILSGKKINISDNLFALMVNIVNATNKRIKDGELFFNEGTLYEANPINKIRRPRLKSTTPETVDPTYTTTVESNWWGTTTTTQYDQKGAYDYYHDYEKSGTIQSGIAGVITSFASAGVGVAFAVGLFIISYTQGEKIFQAAESGGIKVVQNSNNMGSLTTYTTRIYNSKNVLILTIN